MTSTTYSILRALIIMLFAVQFADFATMAFIGLESEINPLPGIIGIPLFGVLKMFGTAVGVFLAMKMPEPWSAVALTVGIIIGSIGLGTNIAAILGAWRLGLL